MLRPQRASSTSIYNNLGHGSILYIASMTTFFFEFEWYVNMEPKHEDIVSKGIRLPFFIVEVNLEVPNGMNLMHHFLK